MAGVIVSLRTKAELDAALGGKWDSTDRAGVAERRQHWEVYGKLVYDRRDGIIQGGSSFGDFDTLGTEGHEVEVVPRSKL